MTLTLQEIDEVTEEMKRLHKRIQELRTTIERKVKNGWCKLPHPDQVLIDYPKEQGAVRRASLDLSRSLAKLRKVK